MADDGSPGTLRAALAAVAADARPTADTVAFAVDGIVTLTGGELTLSRTAGPVTITGAGHAVTVDANRASRAFAVTAGATAGLIGLTLENGSAPSAGGGRFGTAPGGAVVNAGTLTLTGCTLTGNFAFDGGEAIANTDVLTLTTCTVAGNTAIDGAAIYNSGVLTLRDCTVASNTAFGGAAVANASGATLAVAGSVVSGNTFAAASGTTSPDLSGAITADGGYNLFGTALAGTTRGPGDVFSDAPLLDPLADNGGPTQTMALLPGSPAFDAGKPADTSADQRGVGVQNGRRDIGAFEAAPAATTTTTAPAMASYRVAAGSVTLTAAVTGPAGPVAGGTVTFTVLSGSAVVGSPVAGAIAGGIASVGYLLPAGTPAGAYTVRAVYDGGPGLAGSADPAETLTVTPAETGVTSTAVGTDFSVRGRTVSLAAAVTSPAGVVDGGTVTFTVLNGAAAVGGSVTVSVAAGAASAAYALPAGLPAGMYAIRAVYTGTADLAGSAAPAETLTVAPAASAVGVAAATAVYSGAAQTVMLTATVASPAGVVGEGVVTFTVRNGSSVVGTPVAAAVSGGVASAAYAFPAGADAGAYTVSATFDGAADFATAGGAGGLSVAPAATAVTISASGAAIAFGRAVSVTAAVGSAAGVPGGVVQFTVDGVSVGVPIPLAGGTAALTLTTLAAGPHTATAAYLGSLNFAGSARGPVGVTVDPPIAVGPADLPGGEVRAAYRTAVVATGGTGAGFTYAATGRRLGSRSTRPPAPCPAPRPPPGRSPSSCRRPTRTAGPEPGLTP